MTMHEQRKSAQLDLFAHVAKAYETAQGGVLSNAELYEVIAEQTGISHDEMIHKSPIGQSQSPRSVIKRKIRWYQQTLKQLGVLERVDGRRGVWKQTKEHSLHEIVTGISLVAFSTRLGAAIWGDSRHALTRINTPIALCVTSPPYPLAKPRSYGNLVGQPYIDFVCETLEPIVKNLVKGGSICINLGNDVFEPNLPARSLYRERLILALQDRLGLHKIDELIWWNKSRPPGPTTWACVRKQIPKGQWEPVYWLSPDPEALRSDTRRVCVPHSAKHQRLLDHGGETRVATYGDGAYRLHDGSFGRQTPGTLPSNVLELGHGCADTRALRKAASCLGMPPHGATQPTTLPAWLIRMLTEPGDLVVDCWAGWAKTALAAERLDRRWLVMDRVFEYLRVAAERFRLAEGFRLHTP